MSFNYGLSSNDLQNAKDKLAKQKDFLESHSMLSDEKTGEMKSLLDFSYSANLSKRYYPRILNKVDTFVSINTSRNYIPIFLTITLDGFFRDTVKGDYSRFKGDIKEKYIKGKHIPNNDRMGHIIDWMEEGKPLTPKLLYKVLGWQLHRFIRSNTLQQIRKNGEDYSFIRVTEPHKDGVPHFHILMYIPNQYVKDVYKEFTKFFPAPQNHKRINKKEDKRDSSLIFDNQYETKGFQIEIRSPAGYLLKYILKSFRNLIKEEELDYLQAWYVHNKIPRIITTHTLLSQHMYHHASLLDSDWFYLTEIKLNGIIKKDLMMNSFHLISDNRREIIYTNGRYQLLNSGKVIQDFGIDKNFKLKFTVECPIKYPKQPQTVGTMLSDKYWKFRVRRRYVYKMNDVDDLIPLEIDNQMMFLDTNTGEIGYRSDFLPITQLSDQELFYKMSNFDIDKHDIVKLGQIRRVMIERGLLKAEDMPLQDYRIAEEVF